MKRLILVGRLGSIEPLGILHLLGVADRAGWKSQVHLVERSNFEPLIEEVQEFHPDLVGFSVWTGWHLPAFAAADRIRRMGVKVVIGGPHATYFERECEKHADWVIRGEGFRNFRLLLEGKLEKGGIYFDEVRMAEGFPVPRRDVVYERYPKLGASRIKSIMCSVGCPFRCTYCYAPVYNALYGGFQLNLRPVDEIIEEAIWIRIHYPLELIYFQDDIFGFSLDWLEEFAEKWPKRVGVPAHAQIRLEMVREERRLNLFAKAGITGLTLAIEHGSGWMRRFVLNRPMTNELINEGIRKIQAHGLTLRTEQIYSIPFSTFKSDLETLEMNVRLNPTMMWTSILAPYRGTVMGDVAEKLGIYPYYDNDDLGESFFERSVLCHVSGGRHALARVVLNHAKGPKDNPLERMVAIPDGAFAANVCFEGEMVPVAHIKYMDHVTLERYRSQTVMLQRLSNWLSRVHEGHRLARRFLCLPETKWSWERLGSLTAEHLDRLGLRGAREKWLAKLAEEFGCTPDLLPKGVAENPFYFCFFPGAAALARKMEEGGFFATADWSVLNTVARHHLFDTGLYKVEPATPPIATR